jgi:hypothetical protein
MLDDRYWIIIIEILYQLSSIWYLVSSIQLFNNT